MDAVILVESTRRVASDVVAVLLLLPLATLVWILLRRIRRDRRVSVDEEIRVLSSAEEVSRRIATALGSMRRATVTQPDRWQYVVTVKHISALTAALGGVILASLARSRLVLQVALFQDADSTVVVRLSGETELSVVDALRTRINDP